MIYGKIREYLTENSISYEENVKLQKKTWIHRGGTADFFILPSDSNELKKIVRFFYINAIEFKLFGHTSNLYVRNETNIPVVVSTIKCRKYEVNNNILYCEPGVGIIKLAKDMISNGIVGFEYLTGLPGTIAAALVNNSSCKYNSISNILISAEIILSDGSIKVFKPCDFEFAFRTSVFKKKRLDGTIVSVQLKADRGIPENLMKIAQLNEFDRDRRLDGHSKNLGCTVHNPFSLGKMSLKYSIVVYLIKILTKVFCISTELSGVFTNYVLCCLSGCKEAFPYISKKNVIVFMWLDDGADKAFPIYLKFMKTVYKTEDVEIEIL